MDTDNNTELDFNKWRDIIVDFFKETEYSVENYVKIFIQIKNMVRLFGGIFKFIVTDLNEKINILIEYLKQDIALYGNLRTMIIYEKDNGILEDEEMIYKNATRVYFLLNNGFELLIKVLENSLLKDDEKSMYKICHEVYKETISKTHPYLIQKAVHLACYTLPDKKKFYQTVLDQQNIEWTDLVTFFQENQEHFHEILNKGRKIIEECNLPEFK